MGEQSKNISDSNNDQYIVDNFLIDHSKNIIYIDFHSELRATCDQEKQFLLSEFKSYLLLKENDYLKDYFIPDTEEEVFWFEALENIKQWHVEGFLNQQLKNIQTNNLDQDLDLIGNINALRKLYKSSRIGNNDINNQKKIWEEIERTCNELKIDNSIIQISDEAFALMTEAVMQKYILS